MTKKRGRPPKSLVEEAVEAPVAETPNPGTFSKRAVLSGDVDAITITVAKDGRKHIDCGGFSIFDTCMILKTSYEYMFNTIKKEASLNGTEEGTANPVSGSDT